MKKETDENKLKIVKWWSGTDQTFTISGYAGTGKTTLSKDIPTLLKLKPNKVAYSAPTGKAASLLEKGRTIHSLIYYSERDARSGKLKFKLRQKLTPKPKLIIVDEASMIDKELQDHLESFGIRIIYIGDPFQLPPIKDNNNILENPDIFLTKVYRGISTIIDAANDIREGKTFQSVQGVIHKTYSMSMDTLFKSYMSGQPLILCGLNKTRVSINHGFRKRLNYNDVLVKGETIIGLKNALTTIDIATKAFWFINGLTYTIEDIYLIDRDTNLAQIQLRSNRDDESKKIVVNFSACTDIPSRYKDGMAVVHENKIYDIMELKRKMRDKKISSDLKTMYRNIIKKFHQSDYREVHYIDYAYALTCHKAQGGEADNVVVIDESFAFQENQRNWLYTAITRSRKKIMYTKKIK